MHVIDFTHQIHFDSAGDFEAFLKSVPPRWCVYLMSDADDRPVQLLMVRNLRASLKRRLGGQEMVGPTRRVNYRELVRRISFIRVDSEFEADIVYLELARRIFPESFKGMTGLRPAWFIHVNPLATFPRYIRTTDLSLASGELFGPLEDKHAAQRLIEHLQDWFDLCRYYNILVQAPHGTACAYKEMGKCPAPCDGSISMEQYRLLIEHSTLLLKNPPEVIRQHTQRMQQAAGELRFEQAGKIKQYIESLAQVGTGAYRHVRPLAEFNFLSLQRGPASLSAKVFLITPGQVQHLVSLCEPPLNPGELIRLALESLPPSGPVDESGAMRLSVVAQHLFGHKQRQGVFLPMDMLDDQAIHRGWRQLQKQKTDIGVEDSDDEGATRELEAI